CVSRNADAVRSERGSAGRGRARSHPRHLSPPARGRARAAPRLERRYRRGRGARRDGRGGVRELIRAAGGPSRLVPAWTTHGVRFVAALEQSGERLLACQFHPELSGAYGAALLERWLAGAKGAPAPALAGATPGPLPRVVPRLDVRDGRVGRGGQVRDP